MFERIKILYYIYFFILFILACERISHIEIPENEPILVIDAVISYIPDISTDIFCHVVLSTTLPYNKVDPIPRVTDAIVSISYPGSKDISFKHIEEGIYVLSQPILFKENTEYELKVIYKEKIYTANTKIPKTLPLNKELIDVDRIENIFLFSYANENFQDLLNSRKTHSWGIYVDNNIDSVNDILFHKYEGNEEKQFSYAIILPSSDEKHTVRLELININREAYDYFHFLTLELLKIDRGSSNYYFSLQLLTSNSLDRYRSNKNPLQHLTNSSSLFSPKNPPTTNIKGGALGIFAAVSISSIEMEVD